MKCGFLNDSCTPIGCIFDYFTQPLTGFTHFVRRINLVHSTLRSYVSIDFDGLHTPCLVSGNFGAGVSMSSIRSRLLQNLVSQQTAGYAISVLFACCFTQMCFAVTEAHTSHGYKVFPTHFSSYIAAEQPFRHCKR